MIAPNQSIRRRLERSHPAFLAVYACVAAFAAYCCMYAMRKPFTAASYEGMSWMGVHFKIVLVVSQVLGYALSKFIGIRVISAMQAARRAVMIVGLLGIAEISLLGFALTPYPYNAFWLFLNGLPLGMIWGLVFGYLEGRRVTELLTAAISINFIISSGFVKSVGQWLLLEGISEFWMPFVAGIIFFPPLLLATWMLEQIPPPSEADKAMRNERTPMSGAERRALWSRYSLGFTLLIIVYLLLTILRDMRDNFAVEIWRELGYSGQPGILTYAELPVALLTLVGLGALILIKNNFTALWINHLLTVGSALLLAGTTFAFDRGMMGPVSWMILSGFALFLPYIVFNGMLWDRMLAAFREAGNVGFLMYMADAFGYLGSVGIMLWRNFGFKDMSWLSFYKTLCYVGSGIFALFAIASLIYFYRKRNR